MKTIMFFAYLLAFLCSTCRDEANCHKTITFVNNTASAVYVMWDIDDFPDTTSLRGTLSPSTPNTGLNRKVDANSENDAALRFGGSRYRDCYESTMEYSAKSDTLMVYVFDANLVETGDWGEIVRNNRILHRYDLSLQDLKNRNWRITYP